MRRLPPFAAVFIMAFMLLTLAVSAAYAQDIEFEWLRWDDTINVFPEQNELNITETQEFSITSGEVRRGSRTWDSPVEMAQVFVVPGDGQPVELTPGQSEQPGTYTFTQSGSESSLTYYLPEVAQAGDTFLVQINYTTPIDVAGVVDWIAIPGVHAFPIQSSTITVNFAEGEAPDAGLARVVSGNGTVDTQGSSIIFRSTGPIEADEMFAIQLPYGEGVGAAVGGTGNTGQAQATVPAQQPPREPVPDAGGSDPLGGLLGGGGVSTLCVLLCLVGALVVFGGGNLLRGLGGLGGLGGSGSQPRGGIFPTPRRNVPPRSSPGSSPTRPTRGFRRSGNQSRNLPSVRRKKGSGGSAGLG